MKAHASLDNNYATWWGRELKETRHVAPDERRRLKVTDQVAKVKSRGHEKL